MILSHILSLKYKNLMSFFGSVTESQNLWKYCPLHSFCTSGTKGSVKDFLCSEQNKGLHNIYELYGTGACATGHSLFSHLKKRGNDFFGVFNYGTRTFLSKIILREMSRYPWTCWSFIVTTRHP